MRLLPWEYAVRNLGRHPLRLGLSVAGSAIVVMMILSAAAFVRGMEKSMQLSGGEKNVLLIGAGSEESLERSELSPSVAGIAAASIDGKNQNKAGEFHTLSPEVQMASLVKDNKDGERTYLTLFRGANSGGVSGSPAGPHHQRRHARPERAARRPARRPAKMGIAASQLAIGQTLWFDGRPWTIRRNIPRHAPVR